MNGPVEPVVVWSATLDLTPVALAGGLGILAPDERAQADRFVRPLDRERFLARRILRRRVLADVTGVPAAALAFAVGEFGKPALAGPGAAAVADVRFSCSASGGRALVAVVVGREVGVDLERHQPADDDLNGVVRMFAAEEQAALGRLTGAAWTQAFFDCWSRKEAFVKALGHGLSHPLDAFAVSVAPAETMSTMSPVVPAMFLRGADPVPAPGPWSLHALTVAPGFSAALVVAGPAVVCLREWPWSTCA